MTFDAFSLNYTYNISTDPLGWNWILKVEPLFTFLSKKIGTFSDPYMNTDSTETERDNKFSQEY